MGTGGGGRAGGLLLALLLGACAGGGGGGAAAAGGATTAATGVRGEVTVYAAASLNEAFAELGAAFRAANPGSTVTFNLAGSQQLAAQIVEGAPADVLASADQRQMDVVREAGLVEGTAEVFTANVLEIAVEPGNPRGVRDVADLADPGLAVVLAAEEVPVGRYARELLADAGIAVTPASLEVDVRAVLSRVALGEADAGVVYRSDVAAADGTVEGVAIPADRNVRASYPIAALSGGPNPEGAAAFVDLVLSAEGRAILASHGFAPPGAGG